MLQRIFSFTEIGVYKQENSNNEAEAQRNLNISCSRCRHAGDCDENRCAIMKAHKLKLAMLKFNRMPTSNESRFVKTRPYHITKTNMGRAQSLKKLNRVDLEANEIAVLKTLLKDGGVQQVLTALVTSQIVDTAREIAVLTKKKTWFEKFLKEYTKTIK